MVIISDWNFRDASSISLLMIITAVIVQCRWCVLRIALQCEEISLCIESLIRNRRILRLVILIARSSSLLIETFHCESQRSSLSIRLLIQQGTLLRINIFCLDPLYIQILGFVFVYSYNEASLLRRVLILFQITIRIILIIILVFFIFLFFFFLILILIMGFSLLKG